MKKKKKNSRSANLIVIVMLAIGIGILVYPTISDLFIRHQLSEKIKDYEALAAEQEDLSKYWEAAEEYNKYLRTKESQFKVDDEEKIWIDSLLNPEGSEMLGSIEIPKININIPIYRGTDEKQLQSGAGWWYGTSLPTGSPGTHAVITAHSGLVKTKLFTELDRLQPGDKFTVKILDKEFEYTVASVKVTLPEENSDLFVIDDKDYITLYTCTPIGVNDHRLLVRGERKHDLPQKSSSAKTGLNTDQTVLTVLMLITGTLFLVLCVKMSGIREKDKWTA